MTVSLPAVADEFYWEVTRPIENDPAQIHLIRKSEPGVWELLPNDRFAWFLKKAIFERQFYDFGYRDPKRPDSLIELVSQKKRATHVRRNGLVVEQTSNLSDEFTSSELIEAAVETLRIWGIRQNQEAMYGNHEGVVIAR